MNEHQSNYLPYILIAVGAVLWGSIGIFIDALDRAGFTSLQIVALRVVSATVMLLVYLLMRSPRLLIIEAKDIIYFVGTGILSISFFNWCYFTAIKEVSLSVAVILLYTGPAFVVIMSRLFFGERLTGRKVTALLLTISGAVLVVQLFPFNLEAISRFGILVGLGSGFGYALYSIFGKKALDRYSSPTILFYTFLMASLAMVPLSGLAYPGNLESLNSQYSILWILGLGLFPTVLAYLFYTEGLSRIEAGKASIAAMLEPLTAALIGVLAFEEKLSAAQVIGMVLILSSVLLIQVRNPVGRLFREKKFSKSDKRRET